MRKGLVAGAAATFVAALSAAPAAAVERSCGWLVEFSSDQVNLLYPDQGAKYWVTRTNVPSGGYVELHGRYPHARYLSFNTYDPRSSAIDAIADVEIKPDHGSHNPFVAGANRRREPRFYTVKVVNARLPKAGRARNTVYLENADGSKSARAQGNATVVIRVYVPDRGRDPSGGVGLPEITTVSASGARSTLPHCGDLGLPNTGLTETFAASGLGVALPKTGLFARNPIVWHKYTNPATSISSFFFDNDGGGGPVFQALQSAFDRGLPNGGLFENIHNKYLYASYGADFGRVLVLRGRLPRTPKTYEGQRTMGRGDLRYWSLCANTQLTTFLACLTDTQVPIDRKRNFTIAISTAASRPRNAVERCGVAWLPAGPAPQMILILRNMLPSPSFRYSIQRATAGKEKQGLGPYYPRGTYYATPAAADAALGCRRSAD